MALLFKPKGCRRATTIQPFYLLLLPHEETKWFNIHVHLMLEKKLTHWKETRYRKLWSKMLSTYSWKDLYGLEMMVIRIFLIHWCRLLPCLIHQHKLWVQWFMFWYTLYFLRSKHILHFLDSMNKLQSKRSAMLTESFGPLNLNYTILLFKLKM